MREKEISDTEPSQESHLRQQVSSGAARGKRDTHIGKQKKRRKGGDGKESRGLWGSCMGGTGWWLSKNSNVESCVNLSLSSNPFWAEGNWWHGENTRQRSRTSIKAPLEKETRKIAKGN